MVEEAEIEVVVEGDYRIGMRQVYDFELPNGNIQERTWPFMPTGDFSLDQFEDHLGKDLSGLNAVVIGRSNIVGKPMASLLLQANATVTVTHSRTRDLPGVVRQADIVVAAVGRANMVEGDWVKPGAVVIDVGINRVEVTVDGESKSRLTGDVDYDSVCEVAKAVTPVPGGVGPLTIAMLLRNTLTACSLQV